MVPHFKHYFHLIAIPAISISCSFKFNQRQFCKHH